MAPNLAHFELREKIGLGAMGAVYRAEDSRLGRTVAIKLLLPEVNEDLERRSRFLREARAAAGLNHPNIAMIFEVGEARFEEETLAELGLHRDESGPPGRAAEELPFFAMEFVPGEDLGALMETEGRLSIDSVVDLARQIASALEAAHGAGIVHRDLKPANVRVTPNGRAKLLDFGLAKLLSREMGRTVDSGTGSQLTLDGMVMGTLPYLAPEQLQGLKIDGRADLFALGVMLYEMLTGTSPFPSASMVEYARSLLVGDVERPAALRPEVPAWLDRLVMGLLHTDPEGRPMSAAVVRMELEEHMTSYRDASGSTVTMVTPEPKESGPKKSGKGLPAIWMTAATVVLVVLAGIAVAYFYGRVEEPPARLVTGPPAVAVLPVTDAGQAVPLATGLLIYLHRRFQLLPRLAVRDLDDVMLYATVAAGNAAIGRELRADWVLSGEVLDAEPLRLRLGWVRSSDGHQLWAQEVDLSGENVLEVQGELFERVLAANEDLRTVAEAQPATGSRAALRSYLVALARLHGSDPSSARAAFERSLAEDPEFFWARVDASGCLRRRLCRSQGAMTGAEAALEILDPVLYDWPYHPLALLERAHLDLEEGREDEAASTVERLLAEHPTLVPALELQAEISWRLGRPADARAMLERALRQDPGSWRLHDRLGRMLAESGDLQAAAHQLAEADRLSPSRSTVARSHRAEVLWRLGRAQDILDLQSRSPLRIDRPELAQWMGRAHEALGKAELARSMFGLAVELDPSDPHSWYQLGRHYERTDRQPFALASFNEARKIWRDRLADAGPSATEIEVRIEAPGSPPAAPTLVPRSEAVGWLAFFEAKRGRCENALAALDGRLEEQMGHAEQAGLAARTLELCGRPEEAELLAGEALRRGLELPRPEVVGPEGVDPGSS